jgi:mRNA interferase RelE/StbE
VEGVRPAIPTVGGFGALPPERIARRAIKHALAELRRERGDIRALEANLSGHHRLRVGRHRIIFSYVSDGAI